MEKVNFNQEWYGTQAKVLFRDDIRIVIDYGCNGRELLRIITFLTEYNYVFWILKRMK